MNHCPRCGEPVPSGSACRRCGSIERRTRAPRPVPAGALVSALRGLEIAVGASGSATAAAREFLIDPVAVEPPPPVELELLDADVIDLRTGDHFDAPFEVRDPRPCTLTGRVLGLAGGSRDVEVYVLDDDGYQDWQNGIRPRALFQSGRTSATTLEVDLPKRGRYHLLLSNRYSILTAKRVRIDDARLRCA
jgi:hypothetical protein